MDAIDVSTSKIEVSKDYADSISDGAIDKSYPCLSEKSYFYILLS